jgi:hypothetical protein
LIVLPLIWPADGRATPSLFNDTRTMDCYADELAIYTNVFSNISCLLARSMGVSSIGWPIRLLYSPTII